MSTLVKVPKSILIKDNILRRQLTPFQMVEAGKELEKIYEGRVGRPDKLGTDVPNSLGRTRELVAKDFGISGRTYERYKKAYELVKDNPIMFLKSMSEKPRT